MSRQRRNIIQAAKNAGLTILEMTWTPIGQSMEMCGPSGGWFVDTEEAGDLIAYNADEIVQQIKNWEKHGWTLDDESTQQVLLAITKIKAA